MQDSTRPHVYWLTEAFFPPLVGGQELIAAHLAQGLHARGFQVQVVTRQTLPASASRENIEGVEVLRIDPPGMLKGKGFGAILPVLGFLVRLTGILIRDASRYDILLVSGAKIMPLVVVPLCLLLRKKCVLRVESYFELHETISTESMRTMGSRWGRLLFGLLENVRNRALRRAHAVIAISDQIKGELLKRGVAPEKIVPVPNGVSLRKFRPVSPVERAALRARLSLPDDGRPLVLYAGRLARAKGVPLLIEAWPTLFARHPDLYLVLVGSGSRSFDDCEAQVKERVKELGLEQDVMFVPETDAVVEYLQAADLWVFPTEYEGFSLALAEAMGCALTILATSVGAAPQLIQHGRNGFLFPPLDSQALINAFEEALAVRNRWPSIGAAAREGIGQYDLDLIATRYAQLCRSLLDGRGTGEQAIGNLSQPASQHPADHATKLGGS
jgi:glycosyltransferase involved in cell wall biosynthesis